MTLWQYQAKAHVPPLVSLPVDIFPDSWYRQTEEPAREEPGLPTALQQSLAFVQVVDPLSIRLDSWYLQTEEPIREEPGLSTALQQHLALAELVRISFADTFPQSEDPIHPAPEPLFQYEAYVSPPRIDFFPQYEGFIIREEPHFHYDAQVIVDPIIAPPVVFLDWYQQTQEPARIPEPTFIYPTLSLIEELIPLPEGILVPPVFICPHPDPFPDTALYFSGMSSKNLTIPEFIVCAVDVWNTALAELGITRVGSIFDTTRQALILNQDWIAFRRDFLALHPWNGAKKEAVLSVSTSVPVARWTRMFSLPSDHIRTLTLNAVERAPGTDIWEEQVNPDTGTIHLFTDAATAIIEYIYDPIEVCDLMPKTQFAMGLALAVHHAQSFGKSAQEIARLQKRADEAISTARATDSMVGSPRRFIDDSLVRARLRGASSYLGRTGR